MLPPLKSERLASLYHAGVISLRRYLGIQREKKLGNCSPSELDKFLSWLPCRLGGIGFVAEAIEVPFHPMFVSQLKDAIVDLLVHREALIFLPPRFSLLSRCGPGPNSLRQLATNRIVIVKAPLPTARVEDGVRAQLRARQVQAADVPRRRRACDGDLPALGGSVAVRRSLRDRRV